VRDIGRIGNVVDADAAIEGEIGSDGSLRIGNNGAGRRSADAEEEDYEVIGGASARRRAAYVFVGGSRRASDPRWIRRKSRTGDKRQKHS
jgi:hypothetical protein